MRTDVSGALAAALDAGSFAAVADLYTLTLKGGAVYRWTSADVDVVAGGYTFTRCGANGAPLIKRPGLRRSTKLEIDELEIMLLCGDGAAMLGTVPIAQAAMSQLLDCATLQIDMAFLVGTTWEVLSAWFMGNVSKAEPTGTTVRMLVRSDLEDLGKPLPRHTYQVQCGHALYDDGCAVAKASFAASMTVGAGATLTSIPATGAQASGWFDGGFIVFTSGPLTGLRASVKAWTTGGTLALARPLPSVPSAGVTLTAYPGCDKTRATCETKFANLTRFRGFPYIPRRSASTVADVVEPVSPDAGAGRRRDGFPPRQVP